MMYNELFLLKEKYCIFNANAFMHTMNPKKMFMFNEYACSLQSLKDTQEAS